MNTQHEVTAPKCATCGKFVGAIQHDDDGREYRDCDCTRKARAASQSEHVINPGNGQFFSYDLIRKQMGSEPYPMSLVDADEVAAVCAAVNQGIDAHLEACFSPDRGDSTDVEERKAGDTVVCRAQSFVFSVESLPVLLRRLLEDSDDAHADAAYGLASAILETLKIELV